MLPVIQAKRYSWDSEMSTLTKCTGNVTPSMGRRQIVSQCAAEAREVGKVERS